MSESFENIDIWNRERIWFTLKLKLLIYKINLVFLGLKNSSITYIQLPNPLTAFVVLVKWSKVMKRRTYFVLLKLLLVNVLWRCCCCVVSRFMMVFLLSITVLKDIIFVKPFMVMTNWCLCLFYIRRIFWKSWNFWPFTLNFVIYNVHIETPENIYFTLSHSCYLSLNWSCYIN